MRQIDRTFWISRETFGLCFTFLALTLFHFSITLQTAGPVVLDDELGYLANAAFLTGIDWSDAVDQTYYAFGYSLVLIPSFLLFDDGRTVYRAALILNGIFASSIFALAYFVGRRFAPDAKKWMVGVASAVVSLYPSNVVYTQTALAENFLALVYWISVLFTLHLNRKRAIYFGAFGLLVAFLFAIHQRALCMVAGATVVIFLLRARKQISNRHVVLYLSSVLTAGSVSYLTHKYFQNNVWGLNVSYRMSDRVEDALLSIAGLKQWFEAAAGQLFYLGVASALMVFVGLTVGIPRAWRWWATSRPRPIGNESEMWSGFTSGYVVLSFLFTFLLSVTFCYKGAANFIVYGRYNEAVIGPLLLIGLLGSTGLIAPKVRWRTVLLFLVLLLMMALPVYLSGKLATGPTFNIQITGLSLFKKSDWHVAIWQAFFATAIVSGILFALLVRRPSLGMFYLATFFLCVAREGLRDHILSGTETWNHMTNITGWLEQHSKGETVGYLSRGSWYADLMKKRYQIWLKEKRIKSIGTLDAETINSTEYLITSRKDLTSKVPQARPIIVEKNGAFTLWSLSREKWKKLDRQGVAGAGNGIANLPSYSEEALPTNSYRTNLTLIENGAISVAPANQQYLWIMTRLDMIESASGIRAVIKQLVADREVVTVRIRHEGAHAGWSRLVRLGIVWQPGDGSGKWLGEQRATLPSVLRPGDETEMNVLLEPVDYKGRPLPAGKYIVMIDLVHEKVSWFNSRGNQPLKLDVQIR